MIAGKIRDLKKNKKIVGAAPTIKSGQRQEGYYFVGFIYNDKFTLTILYLVVDTLRKKNVLGNEEEEEAEEEEEEEEEEAYGEPVAGGYVVYHVHHQECDMVIMAVVASPAITLKVTAVREGVTLHWESSALPTTADLTREDIPFLNIDTWVKSEPPANFKGDIFIHSLFPVNVEKWSNEYKKIRTSE